MVAIPGYRDLECIHRGSNSVVYSAFAIAESVPVIIKTLGGEYPSTREMSKLKREFEIARGLSSDHVVRPLTLLPHHNGYAIVFEDFGGIDLGQLIASSCLSLRDKLRISVNVARALAEIHLEGVIHKDIKPGNIIVNPDNKQTKLTDFRIASQLAGERQEISAVSRIEGSPAYMAPEQTGRVNRSIDHRADLYAFGVTLFELLSGRLPFQADNPLTVLHHQIALEPEWTDTKGEVPEILKDITLKLLAKNAEERYRGAYGVMADLERCLEAMEEGRRPTRFHLAQSDTPLVFQVPEKLYGRAAELAALSSVFEEVLSGYGKLVLIAGAPGVGKSALVRELQQPVGGANGRFVTGKYDQLKREIPYFGIAEAFRELVRQILTEGEEGIESSRGAILEAVGDNGHVIIEVIPELEYVIGPQAPVQELPPVQAQARFDAVFLNFFKALVGPSQPLLVFLDDLQWADSASLRLLEVLLPEARKQCLMIVGAFRENEVDAAHPLRLFIDNLKKKGIPYNHLTLKPLSPSSTHELLRDALSEESETISGLAALVGTKTHGNPFFVKEFLRSVHREGMLAFDIGSGRWTWDLDAMSLAHVTDNVVDFMCDNIRLLPTSTQKVLEVAAVIGIRFELDLLSRVMGQSERTVHDELWAALRVGLVSPLGEAYKYIDFDRDGEGTSTDKERVIYGFAHDRVLEAANALLEPPERTQLHLHIGQILLETLSEQDRKDRVFEIVGHLNQVIGDFPRKLELARLNLQAGRKAKASNAFQSAFDLIQTGADLLGDDTWHTHYELTRDLYTELADVLYLKGESNSAEQLTEKLLEHLITSVEKAAIYRLRVLMRAHLNQMPEAVEAGLSGLQLLGIRLAAHPPKWRVGLEFARAALELRGHKASYFLELPEVLDPRWREAMRIIAVTAAPAFLSDQSTFALLTLRGARLPLKYGASDATAISAVAYSFGVMNAFEDYEAAVDFSQTAIALTEKYPDLQMRAKTLFLSPAFFLHWKRPYRQLLPLLDEAIDTCAEACDYSYWGFAVCSKAAFWLVTGRNLNDSDEDLERYLELASSYQDKFTLELLSLYRQLVACLNERTRGTLSFSSDTFDEEQELKKLEKGKSASALFHYYLWKGWVHILFGHKDALHFLELAEPHASAAHLLISSTEHAFYKGVAAADAALCEEQPARSPHMKTVKKALRLFRKWNRACGDNFEHRYLLLQAEMARLRGNMLKASQLYDKAITRAREGEFVAVEALANERAAVSFLAVGQKKIAKAYLQDARYLYKRWGAHAKVHEMNEKYCSLFLKGTRSAYSREMSLSENFMLEDIGSTETDLSYVDFTSILRASQRLSEEVVLERLLRRLMQIAIENAGAQRGIVLLYQGEQLAAWAEGSLSEKGNDVQVTLSLRPTSKEVRPLPKGLLDYVARTRLPVTLAKPHENELFGKDPYFSDRKCSSVLCLPIVRRGDLAGTLYLENDLTEGTFTKRRLEVLEILSAQIAISVENAVLYENLEGKVAERTKALQEALARIQHISNTDELTGLSNRRSFFDEGKKELKRAERRGSNLAFMMLDIDHFKTINDTWGHRTGDAVLRQLAAILRRELREIDIIGRIGGEEFAAILADTDLDQALIVGERLRSAIANSVFASADGQDSLLVTASFGLASVEATPFPELESLYSKADAAMYKSKQGGRNRATCWGSKLTHTDHSASTLALHDAARSDALFSSHH